MFNLWFSWYIASIRDVTTTAKGRRMAQSQAANEHRRLFSERPVESLTYLDDVHWSDISEARLLEMMLSLNSPEGNANQQAAAILETVGSLNHLIHLPAHELRNAIPANPDMLTLVNLLRLSMHRIINERTSDQIRLSSPKSMVEYAAAYRDPDAGGKRRVLLLDRDSRLIFDFSMPLSQSDAIVCRSIALESLERGAFGLIVIDYLYTENLRFSSKTEILCQKIETAMRHIDVNLYDYLIVGIDQFCSKNRKEVIELHHT